MTYVNMYADLLSSPAGPSAISGELKELKNKVEWERGYEELRTLREVIGDFWRGVPGAIRGSWNMISISLHFRFFSFFSFRSPCSG